MGKNLKRKGIGKRHYTKEKRVYHGRYVDRFGARRSVYGTTVKEVKSEAGRGGTKRTKAVKYC